MENKVELEGGNRMPAGLSFLSQRSILLTAMWVTWAKTILQKHGAVWKWQCEQLQTSATSNSKFKLVANGSKKHPIGFIFGCSLIYWWDCLYHQYDHLNLILVSKILLFFPLFFSPISSFSFFYLVFFFCPRVGGREGCSDSALIYNTCLGFSLLDLLRLWWVFFLCHSISHRDCKQD